MKNEKGFKTLNNKKYSLIKNAATESYRHLFFYVINNISIERWRPLWFQLMLTSLTYNAYTTKLIDQCCTEFLSLMSRENYPYDNADELRTRCEYVISIRFENVFSEVLCSQEIFICINHGTDSIFCSRQNKNKTWSHNTLFSGQKCFVWKTLVAWNLINNSRIQLQHMDSLWYQKSLNLTYIYVRVLQSFSSKISSSFGKTHS